MRQSSSNSRTQEDRILWLLHAAWPNWVPAPELAKIGLGYGRAIHHLRHHRGWQIENRVRMVDGVRCGEFRLGSAPVPSSQKLREVKREKEDMPGPRQQPSADPAATDRLFPDDAPFRHKDLG
jgi:hypothetical protein